MYISEITNNLKIAMAKAFHLKINIGDKYIDNLNREFYIFKIESNFAFGISKDGIEALWPLDDSGEQKFYFSPFLAMAVSED
jgi:hypothetical protein